MKKIIQTIPFFMNPDNMQYLLKGKIIENFDEMHKNLLSNIKTNNGIFPIYETRRNNNLISYNSQYPDVHDEIIAKVVRYIKNENNHNSLEVEILNTLKFCKIDNPVININGFYYETESNNIYVTEVTRLTIDSYRR